MQATPQRTCIACKKAGSKDDLIRIVKSPCSSIEFDLYKKLPGRGVYICPGRSCIEKALKKKILVHAFRQDVDVPDADVFFQSVKTGIEEKILSLLGMSWKSGRLVSGTENVLREIEKDRVSLVILAGDASDRLLKKVLDCSGKREVVCCRFSFKEKISRAVGGEEKFVVAIKDFNLAERIKREIEIFHHMETA